MHDRLPLKGMFSGSRVFIKFWEISDNISETVLNLRHISVESYSPDGANGRRRCQELS